MDPTRFTGRVAFVTGAASGSLAYTSSKAGLLGLTRHLASDDASYINGVSLDTNGGLFMA